MKGILLTNFLRTKMLRRMIMIMRNNRIQMATLRQIKDRAKEDKDCMIYLNYGLHTTNLRME